MKTLSYAFQAHLDEGTTTLAWCWRIERADGAVFGFTDHDRVLEFGGVTYEPESGFAASEIRSGSDLAVDAQEYARGAEWLPTNEASMKNPWMSLWLSAADKAAGAARGFETAELPRQ